MAHFIHSFPISQFPFRYIVVFSFFFFAIFCSVVVFFICFISIFFPLFSFILQCSSKHCAAQHRSKNELPKACALYQCRDYIRFYLFSVSITRFSRFPSSNMHIYKIQYFSVCFAIERRHTKKNKHWPNGNPYPRFGNGVRSRARSIIIPHSTERKQEHRPTAREQKKKKKSNKMFAVFCVVLLIAFATNSGRHIQCGNVSTFWPVAHWNIV